MKKKTFFCSIIVSLLFSFSSKSQSDDKTDISLYVKQNVAVIDAMIRSIDQAHYVKELYLVDFKKTMSLPEIFEFNNVPFNDNGLGYDVSARDGIYTSSEQYLHSASTPYQAGVSRKSALKDCIVDVGFVHKSNLKVFLNSYKAPGSAGKIKVSIDCDVYVCNCGSCSCRTCGWPIVGPVGTVIGIVKHCLKIVNCHFEITWE
jgi:hypothetical protein